jgi:hypothetical protein
MVAGLALLAGAGCVPDLAWLPDSSGLVYTTTDWPGGNPPLPAELNGRLMHYDLATKTARVVARTESDTIQPALSPDGKRVAVARVSLPRGRPATLRVVVYDLQGREVSRSQEFPWGEAPAGDVSVEKYAQLFWAPRGEKVIVFANQRTGICDLAADQVVTLGTAGPTIYGTTPIRPDGRGFLIAREGRKVGFVDWDGHETAIDVPTEGLDTREAETFRMPAALAWSRWEGDVAVVTWKGGELRIDTAQKTATVSKPEPAAWSLDGKEVQQLYTFPDGKTRLAVLYLMSYRDFRDAGLPTVRVDLLGPGEGQRRTLVEKTFHCGVYPSPNKELVALRYSTAGAQSGDRHRDLIRVVNQKGETVAEIDTGK